MKKQTLSTLALVLVLLVGTSLLLYPAVSEWWNSMHQSRAMAEYSAHVEQLDPAEYEQMWQAAEVYNKALLDDPDRFSMTDEERAAYEKLLDIDGTGVMGSVEIPVIGCTLPIYHGTTDGALQAGAGHLEGSSLPTGGAGTHCVLSSHRGLPSATLFTNLNKMQLGDTFTLTVLDRTMTYQVDQIVVFEPYDMDALAIDPEQDYCTLVTCTPYGINTHRLLVRGHRVQTDTTVQAVALTSDATTINPTRVAIVLAIPPACIILMVWFLLGRRSKKRRAAHTKGDT